MLNNIYVKTRAWFFIVEKVLKMKKKRLSSFRNCQMKGSPKSLFYAIAVKTFIWNLYFQECMLYGT